VRQPRLESDPVSGVNASGVAINHSGETNERVLIYGIARRGGNIVAAGRAAIERLKADKRHTYHIFLVGDAQGAEIAITAFPTVNSS
jgi:hypothetical protein